jgi:hypothetical protein
MSIEEYRHDLEVAAASHDWSACMEVLFGALYGAAAERQIERCQGVTWPETLLDDPYGWVQQHNREVPQEPEDANAADAAFLFGFDALLNAVAHRRDAAVLTSSVVATVGAAISARATNIWLSDDPEALALWETQSYAPGRSVLEHPAAVFITEQEWRDVAAWLAERKDELVREAEPEEINQALERWREHEMQLIIPRT